MKNVWVYLAVVALLLAGGCGGAKPDLETVCARAEQGDTIAQRALALRYFNADGVEKNFVEAYKWVLIAEAIDHEPVSTTSKKIAKHLTDAQLADAQAQAQKWQQDFRPTPPARR